MYRNYMLGVLGLVLASSYVDRLALGLVLQEIKVDLDLSDTQLGFLSGLAFAVFYSVMGIPLARWADHGNRVTIVTVTTALWSAGVALCGFAGSFVQLLLIRIGVAVGEAGCVPTAHSLIADYFSREERPRAVGIYMLGSSLSMVIGYFVAGWLNEFYGWRMTFVLLGAPGLALAALAWVTLKEPRKIRSGNPSVHSPANLEVVPLLRVSAQPTMREVFATLWRNRTFRQLLLSFSIVSFFSVGLLQWQPAFFMRSHGMQSGELGTWLAIATGIGGMIGTYAGGELAYRYAAGNERLQLQAVAVLMCTLAFLKISIFIAPDRYLALGLLGIAAVGNAMTGGPLFGTIQSLVPENMRAMALALIYLFSNLIGMGLGPLAAGALSDALRPWAGDDSLRAALILLCPGYVCAGWLMWRAGLSVTWDLRMTPLNAGQRQPAATQGNLS